jgi:CheY-like chemotaxis protein
MPEGGRMTFLTENAYLDDSFCNLHSLDLGPGDYVAVTIVDTGVGMNEAVIAHIFDPFFTTKEQGQGTGLGLPGVYGCLKNHHGTIEVSSKPGAGSSFKLLFPAATVDAKPNPAREKQESTSGKEHILVVEDEEIVRNLAVKILTKAGYRVTTCNDGVEAVKLYQNQAANIDLVLLDMMMPKMLGTDAFNALKQIDPNVKAILMSGYSGENVQDILHQGIREFLAKPFRAQQLLRKVRETLDAGTSIPARAPAKT